ncbi:hypothetical protein BH10CYA1_BH10CYA1_62440 [soil metagenome]
MSTMTEKACNACLFTETDQPSLSTARSYQSLVSLLVVDTKFRVLCEMSCQAAFKAFEKVWKII